MTTHGWLLCVRWRPAHTQPRPCCHCGGSLIGPSGPCAAAPCALGCGSVRTQGPWVGVSAETWRWVSRPVLTAGAAGGSCAGSGRGRLMSAAVLGGWHVGCLDGSWSGGGSPAGRRSRGRGRTRGLAPAAFPPRLPGSRPTLGGARPAGPQLARPAPSLPANSRARWAPTARSKPRPPVSQEAWLGGVSDGCCGGEPPTGASPQPGGHRPWVPEASGAQAWRRAPRG